MMMGDLWTWLNLSSPVHQVWGLNFSPFSNRIYFDPGQQSMHNVPLRAWGMPGYMNNSLSTFLQHNMCMLTGNSSPGKLIYYHVVSIPHLGLCRTACMFAASVVPRDGSVLNDISHHCSWLLCYISWVSFVSLHVVPDWNWPQLYVTIKMFGQNI